MIDTVEMDVLIDAMGRLKEKKAVGIDGDPGSFVKLIYKHRAQDMLGLINDIYVRGKLPARWKVARVILLNKPEKDPRLATSYRPISILPAISKVWENTFKTAIKNELGQDPFHTNQFSFRRRRSTTDVIM